PVDGGPRAEVTVGDDFPGLWRVRVEPVAGDRRPEARGGGVELAYQFCRAAQCMFGPGIGREPVAMPGLPARVDGDIAFDEGEYFPAVLDPQHPRGAPEPGRFQMAQVLMHRGRPPSHRAQQLITAPDDPTGHPP